MDEFFVKEFRIDGQTRTVRFLGVDNGQLYWGTYDDITVFPSLFITDSNLGIIESKSYPNLQANSLQYLLGRDTSNNILIFGGINSDGFSNSPISLLKIDSSGNQVWARSYSIDKILDIRPQLTSSGLLVFHNSNFIYGIDVDTGGIAQVHRLGGMNPQVIIAYNTNIYVVGTPPNNGQPRVYSILKLDLSFNVVDSSTYVSSTNFSTPSGGIPQWFIYQNELFLQPLQLGRYWYLRMNLDQPFPQNIDSKSHPFQKVYSFHSDENGGSFLADLRSPATIHRLDSDFNVLLSKSIGFISTLDIFVVNDIILFNSVSNNALFNDKSWVTNSKNLDSNTCIGVSDVGGQVFENINLIEDDTLSFSSTPDSFPTVNSVANSTLTISNSEIFTHCVADSQNLDLTLSTITANPTSIRANGTDTSLITVQLKDASGNNITTGGETVVISDSFPWNTVGTVTDNGNGTYTAIVTAPVNYGTAQLSFTINGEAAVATTEVTFVQTANPDTCEISAFPSTINADGISTTTLFINLYDYSDEDMVTGGDVVIVNTTLGTLGPVIDNNDGTYQATLTSSTITGIATITFTVNGELCPDTTTVTFIQGISLELSTITANPTTILANNDDTSQITVQLKDSSGNNITTGGETVVISHSSNPNTVIISTVVDNNNGTYTAMLKSITWVTTELSFTVNGEDAVNTTEVNFIQTVNPDTCEISASPNTINAGGTATTLITVQLVDFGEDEMNQGGDTVVINTTLGTLGPVIDNNDSTYEATLTSSLNSGFALLSFTVNGEPCPNITFVIFEPVYSQEDKYFVKELQQNSQPWNIKLIGELENLLFWSFRRSTATNWLLISDKYLNKIELIKAISIPNSRQSEIQDIAFFKRSRDFIIVGYFISNSDDTFPFAIRLNLNGTIIWSKSYQMLASGAALELGIRKLNEGLFVFWERRTAIFTINNNGNVWKYLKYTPTTTINIWQKISNVYVTNTNIYVLTEGRSPLAGFGPIAKFDISLNFQQIVEYAPATPIPLPGQRRRQGTLHNDQLHIFYSVGEKRFFYSVPLSSLPDTLIAENSYTDLNSTQLITTGDNFRINDGFLTVEILLENSIFSGISIMKFDENLVPIWKKTSSDVIQAQIFDQTNGIILRPTSSNNNLTNESIIATGLDLSENNCVSFSTEPLPITTPIQLQQFSTQDNPLQIINNPETNDFIITISDVTNAEFIEVCKPSSNTISQSPHLYLQAAGSTGNDGTVSGIHLRWLLKNELSEHLPKGNLATGTANYNKPNDFVTIFRAPYTSAPININLLVPKAVENNRSTWLYQVNGHSFALYFKNRTQYNTTRSSFNPLTQTAQFLQNYGNNILELQPLNDLFFAVEISTSSTSSAARVDSEVLSVEGSTIQRNKQLSVRKSFNGAALNSARIVTENGKGFRFRCTNCYLTDIAIELYSELQNSIESGSGWTELGQFGLTATDSEAFDRLEGAPGQINATWPRFNDGAFVNIQNYRNKWNQNSVSTGSNIKQTVQDYISLSEDENNPTAIETFSFGDSPDGAAPEDNTFDIANLILLQQASLDFHIARMLGMGYLDAASEVQNNNRFVYMAVYRTDVSLVNGSLVAEPVEHRYITVPTSRQDERLPIPIDLLPPVPGIFSKTGLGEPRTSLTDAAGYTQDGKAQYLSLFIQQPVELSYDRGFYNVPTEFNLTEETFPVFVGIEFKEALEPDWRNQELANSPDYQNVNNAGQPTTNETVPIPLPDEGNAVFIHRQIESGNFIFGSYSINWFSRTSRSAIERAFTTTIQPKNTLKPPIDRSALLVTEEEPLLLTSANEQLMLGAIAGDDKTLVRLLFNYHTKQDLLAYKVKAEDLAGANVLDPNTIFPDDQEIFADEIEIYFRDNLPLTVTGKALMVDDDINNELLSVITTGNYRIDSEDEDIIPNIPTGVMPNFVGGILVLEEQEYIIHSVSGNENSPEIRIYKKQVSDRLQDSDVPPTDAELNSPTIREDGKFLAIENLQNVSSWGTPNPHPLKVQIGNNWPIHRELISETDPDGNPDQILQKTRGIWDNATIERILQPSELGGDPTVHKGLYKATFGSALLANHPQASGANPVQWYRGLIRIHTTANPNGNRRELEVFKIENIGTGTALVVHFKDKDFRNDPDHDEIQVGGSVQVNFYPGYRIYLYANTAAGLTENTIVPVPGQSIKYTCFGFKSLHNSSGYTSRIAIPTVMFAQEEIAPLVPQQPLGALYATRPDNFGKATYTFTTQFNQTPHGTLFYRADDNAILDALYTLETVKEIKTALAGSDSDFLPNRWQNLLSFDYTYPANSFQTDGLFAIFPETAEGYRFPNPNNPLLFIPGETPGNLTPGSIAGRIKVVVMENFVQLTEIPILYEHINGATYNPIPKKQVIRDRNGQLLAPNHPDFDMAPMAKIPNQNSVQFTDFTLDGTSNNSYFYTTREIGNTMKMSDYSPILGPVNLVNTNPTIAPGIQQVVPVLENTALGIAPGIEVSINAYPLIENIKRVYLYRALNASDALNIRSMQLVKEIDPGTTNNIWRIIDDFTDLTEIPFGDPLFYKVAVAREIRYADKDDSSITVTDYVSSIPSKLMVTAIVENTNPTAPTLTFTADPVNAAFEMQNVILQFNKTVYKGKYLLFKLNNQGQWVKIYEVATNEEVISIPLDTTDLGSGTLLIEDSLNDNQSIYHQFKVDVENTAGLISQESNILTIPTTNDFDGLGGMIIDQTFIIR
jgi:hypothetical protein